MTAGFARMGEAPFDQLAALPLKCLAFGSLHAGAVFVEGSVGAPASLVGEMAIPLLVALWDVAADSASLYLVDGLRLVVGLVRATLLDVLCSTALVRGAAGRRGGIVIVVTVATEPLVRSIEVVGDRGRVANSGEASARRYVESTPTTLPLRSPFSSTIRSTNSKTRW